MSSTPLEIMEIVDYEDGEIVACVIGLDVKEAQNKEAYAAEYTVETSILSTYRWPNWRRPVLAEGAE